MAIHKSLMCIKCNKIVMACLYELKFYVIQRMYTFSMGFVFLTNDNNTYKNDIV